MDMQDRRVRRTQKALAMALIALTLEKDYETITIREIAERADVGYATFFRHYHDKDALLQDVLEVVLEELTSLLQTPTCATNHAVTGTLVFRYVSEHDEVVRVLLNSRGSAALVQRIIETSTSNIISQNDVRVDSLIPLDIAAHHLVTATMSLIRWWLEHKMPYTPERMGMIYQELIASPVHAIAFSHPKQG